MFKKVNFSPVTVFCLEEKIIFSTRLFYTGKFAGKNLFLPSLFYSWRKQLLFLCHYYCWTIGQPAETSTGPSSNRSAVRVALMPDHITTWSDAKRPPIYYVIYCGVKTFDAPILVCLKPPSLWLYSCYCNTSLLSIYSESVGRCTIITSLPLSTTSTSSPQQTIPSGKV